MRLPLLAAIAAVAASGQAQTAPPGPAAAPVAPAAHEVPFGTSGNAIELEAAGAEGGGPFEVVVASAPEWLQFHAGRAPVDGSVARLAFDVPRTAPVGRPVEVVLRVVAGGVVVGERVVRLAVGAPEELALGAPYPNPSRGAVTVPFEVAAAGPVRLAAYDVLGREVAVLVDGDRDAGAHQARLDVGALAAGVYVVRLVAGSTESRLRRLTAVR